MAVVQRRSDQQQSLDVFDKFNVLPIEMRAMIWREALEEEAKTRFLLYDDSYFEERDGSMGNGAVFFPHKKLRSRLCKYIRTYLSAHVIFTNTLKANRMIPCCHGIVHTSPRAPEDGPLVAYHPLGSR